MPRFRRSMRREQELLEARLESAGNGRRRSGDKAIDDNRDSPCRAAENQARQPGNFQTPHSLQDLQWIGTIGPIDRNCPFDDLNFVLSSRGVQARAAPRHLGDRPSRQDRRDCTGCGGISDSHLTGAHERASAVCSIVGQLDAYLQRAEHFVRGHRRTRRHVSDHNDFYGFLYNPPA